MEKSNIRSVEQTTIQEPKVSDINELTVKRQAPAAHVPGYCSDINRLVQLWHIKHKDEQPHCIRIVSGFWLA